jgi:hypothetical protein
MAGYRVNLTPNNRTKGERERRTDITIPLAIHHTTGYLCVFKVISKSCF